MVTDRLTEIVDQVCSPKYTELFEKVAKEQPDNLSHEENLLLIQYTNEIVWYDGDKRPEIIERFRRTHIKWFIKWLGENNTGRPPYVKWNSIMDKLFLHMENLFFRMDLGDAITTDEVREEFRHVADVIKNILLCINESNPVTLDPSAVSLVQNLLIILFYFTIDNDLAIYLKSLQLIDLINVLIRTSNNDDEIHLQAYRILAVVMSETDLKQLQNSSRIATVFINILQNVIDAGESSIGRLHNSLRSLKILAQHDQIREELIKQGGHDLFLRCAQEPQFNLLKAKLPALEILLALAFNKGFPAKLKNDVNFMNYIRTLTSSSQVEIQRVATALIWKLEKETNEKKIENQSASLPPVTNKQYNIMISYSHNDKELCDRILKSLEKDQFRVWIDSQLMHGATFDAMAKAIENSEFVFVCMSDSYKQSPFCEMEASYAVKRRCRIIPLVMTPNYKADGWLGVLTSALIYIDFPKFGFEKGYQELKKQIRLFRANDQSSPIPKSDQIHHNPSTTVKNISNSHPTITSSKEPPPIVEYPNCIDNWTVDHVRSFLLNKELNSLLSAFEGMNGRLLHKAYLMCQSNQQAMFSSLKEDVARAQNSTLSLKDYLIFLEEIKVYIPYTPNDRSNPTSAVCNLM